MSNLPRILERAQGGDPKAAEELLPLVYDQLRKLAAHKMANQPPGQTLQPTALVHELYLKFFSSEPIEWRDRGHFLAVAARQLRHIVVDYARGQRAQKRGGPQAKVSIEDVPEIGFVVDHRLLDLDHALERLSELDPRSAQVVELRYFGGLSVEETAEALGVSADTVKRDWRLAKLWLLRELEGESA